jgi:hypothetical protein
MSSRENSLANRESLMDWYAQLWHGADTMLVAAFGAVRALTFRSRRTRYGDNTTIIVRMAL